MSRETVTIEQALIEAFIMEKGTCEFYLQASKKSSAADAKNSFDELAAWEQQHMAYLQSLYQSLLDDRELESFAAFSKHVPAPLTETGMPIKDLAKKVRTYEVKDELDALGIAVNIEAQAYNLYKDLANRSTEPELKVIFEEMMSQETKHLDELTRLRKNLPAK